jgi:large subunit ribosomal protein L10
LKLEQKKKITEDLQRRFSKSKVVIVTDYKGLDVASMNDLRRKLREVDVEYMVAKNTLLRRASADNDVKLVQDCFTGPTAIAISYSDPVAPAKVLAKFSEDNKKLEIKGGVLGGKALDLADVQALAKLPSKEVLLGHLLMTMNAVPTGLVTALSDVPRRFLNVLEAIREKQEAA